MKAFKKCFTLMSAIAVAISVCSCGAKPAKEDKAENSASADTVKYTFYAAYYDGEYVALDNMAGNTVTLNADGTGKLDWGENNKGPISEWTQNGDDLVIKAGVSTMNATLTDGVLIVDIDDGMSACFVSPKADTSGMPVITREEFAEKHADNKADNEPGDDPAGVYSTFGISNDKYSDYIVASGDEFASVITLNSDGTGQITTDNDGPAAALGSWTADGGSITLNTTDGDSITGTINAGVITLHFDNTGMTAYYAKENADISSYDLISVEDMKKIIASQSE